jgi:hypothetical protein
MHARSFEEEGMQRALGRLAAQFLSGDPVGKADVFAPVAGIVAAAAPDEERRFGQSSHELLGEQRIQDFLVITFCAAFSLIGWLMIVQGAEQIRLTRAVLQWPTAEGVIEASEAYPVEGSQGARWRPHVTYSYTVGGQVVTATRVALGKAALEADQAAAEHYLRLYPRGSAVQVFFNPRQLTESVIDARTPRTVYVNLVFGAVLALVGPLLLVLFGFWPRSNATQLDAAADAA